MKVFLKEVFIHLFILQKKRLLVLHIQVVTDTIERTMSIIKWDWLRLEWNDKRILTWNIFLKGCKSSKWIE